MAHFATALRSPCNDPDHPRRASAAPAAPGSWAHIGAPSQAVARKAERISGLTRLAPVIRNAFAPSLSTIASTPLLDSLAEPQRSRLLEGSEIRRFRAGEAIFHEGEEAEWVHVLLVGLVELHAGEEPRERTVMLMCPGDIFLVAAATGSEPYLLSAKAVRPSQALLLRAERLRREMLACPHLASKVAMINAGQFRTLVRHLKSLKLRTGPQRLAAFLLRLIDESPVTGSAELPVPKRMLASRIGMTPETLSRTIQLLADHGLRVRGDRAILDDRQRIERFCRPDPLIDGRETSLQVNAL